jgi:hypothetical protein
MRTTEQVSRKERKGRKGVRGRSGAERLSGGDALTAAVERERERVPGWPPEVESVFDHVFMCVCCGRTLGDEKRREPDSEVCLRCVEEAGFWN